MKRVRIIARAAVFAAVAAALGPPVLGGSDAASIIAKSAEALGGMGRIKAVRTLRLEVVYPDHDPKPVIQEIRLPNRLRIERPGEYVIVFDGRNGIMLKDDPANPGAPRVPQDLPAEAARGFETDLVWFFPLFGILPTEGAGTVTLNGKSYHKLVTTLPLGTRAEYFIDDRTFLPAIVAVEEIYQGQTYRMEREWLDLEPVGGLLFPRRMTYPGRGGRRATAELRTIEVDPVLDERRFEMQRETPFRFL